MNGVEIQANRERAAAMVWTAGAAAPCAESFEETIPERVYRALAASWAACGAFEWAALGYLALSSALIVVFSHHLAHPLRLIGLQASVASLILALCYIEARLAACTARRGDFPRSGAHGFWHFWRHWYPHLFFLLCFEEMGTLAHLVYPSWHDAKLIAFDTWLTGVNPSLWLERFAHPALNEFMQFAYLTYFLYLLILGGILYYRREWEAYWAVMTYSVVGYAFGYVIAILFPVQSPWFTLAGMWHGDLAGGPFTALINLIEKCGRVHGAAFPSQHVAGAMAALCGAVPQRPRGVLCTFPLRRFMCGCKGFGRKNQIADVFAGKITGKNGIMSGNL